MHGIINVELLMKLLCIASIENRNSNFAPDVCSLNITSHQASSRKEVYTPEECLAPGSFERDLRKFTNMVVDLNTLMAAYKNLLDCDFCSTHACYEEAQEILFNLNEQVSPCDDFYEFACGGWMKKHTVNETKPYVSVYSELENDIPIQFKSMLEEKIRRKDPDYVRMIKGIYQSCMDVDNMTESEPLKDALKDIGKWPFVELYFQGNESFHWMDILIKLRQKGFSHNTLISLSVVKDPDNSTNNIIKLGQPSLGRDRDYFARNFSTTINDYMELIQKAAYIMKWNDSSLLTYFYSNYAQHFLTVFEVYGFEKDLVERFSSVKESKKLTIQQLSEEVKEIDWFKYFSGILSDKIYGNESVLIDDIHYIKRFAPFVENQNRRTVLNYLYWRVILESLPLLSKDWRTLHERTQQEPEVQENQPRWKQCLDFVTDNFDIAVNTYYLRKYFPGQIIYDVQSMFESIQHIMSTVLMENTWVHNATEQIARQKASSMKIRINYLPTHLLDSNVSGLYADLKLSNESFFDKVLKMRKWSADNSLRLHISPSQRDALELRRSFQEYANGSSAKIIYNYGKNRIEVSTGILQKAFFKSHRPKSLNWGAIGSVIAEKATNAFFDEGRFYDNKGMSVNWWRPEFEDAFDLKITPCFNRQYRKYVEDDRGIHLEVSKVEAPPQYIIQTAGLKAAYLAYEVSVTTEKNELLPGLTYNPNQLFWISAAQAMCEKHTTEYLEKRLSSGSYVPSEFSVIGAMSNLPEFSQDFNCPKGSKMNPEPQCQVW